MQERRSIIVHNATIILIMNIIEIILLMISSQVAEALAHDPDAASHVPEDLWREDLVGIKKHKKEHKHGIRRRRIDLAGSRSVRRKHISRRPRDDDQLHPLSQGRLF